MRKYRVFIVLLVILPLVACANLQAKWNKATDDERARIVIGQIQATLKTTITVGGAWVDQNPQYRDQWKAKVLPAIAAVNAILKDFLAKQASGVKFSYLDVSAAVSAHMTEIRAVLTSWGIKVEGGMAIWTLS